MDVDKTLEDYFEKIKMINVLTTQEQDLESKMSYVNQNVNSHEKFINKLSSTREKKLKLQLETHDIDSFLKELYPTHLPFLNLKIRDKVTWDEIQDTLHKSKSTLYRYHKKFKKDFEKNIKIFK